MSGAEGLDRIAITDAVTVADMAEVASLLRAYAASLSVDLYFQNFDAELAGLPGAYAPPSGRLLVARRSGTAVGCVALKPLGGCDAEMKRLYVLPSARGHQLGRRLVEAIIGVARATGYRRLYLDTLPEMVEAQNLYLRLGFVESGPYVHNPVAGARYMILELM